VIWYYLCVHLVPAPPLPVPALHLFWYQLCTSSGTISLLHPVPTLCFIWYQPSSGTLVTTSSFGTSSPPLLVPALYHFVPLLIPALILFGTSYSLHRYQLCASSGTSSLFASSGTISSGTISHLFWYQLIRTSSGTSFIWYQIVPISGTSSIRYYHRTGRYP
jgi:hypothetical protein